MQISKVGPNLFQFKFQSKFDMDRIMKGDPWSFDNQLLLLQQWKKGMIVGNIQMEDIRPQHNIIYFYFTNIL